MARALTGDPGLVVEFIGLPGVGKSTATRHVASRLAEIGVQVGSRSLQLNEELPKGARVLRKCATGGREAARHPDRLWSLLLALQRTRQDRRADVIRLAYNWLALTAIVRRGRARAGVELLDEGGVQLLWSVALRSQGCADGTTWPQQLVDLARATLAPDVLVVVEASTEEVEARLTSRAGIAGRVDRLDPSERREALRRGAELFDRLASLELTPDGGVVSHTRHLDAGSDGFESALDELADEIAALAGRDLVVAPTPTGESRATAGRAPRTHRRRRRA